MLFKRLSLLTNLLLLAGIILLPFILLWGWLLHSGRIDIPILAFAMSLLVLDTALVAWALHQLLRPLQTTSSALSEIAKGDFATRIGNPYGPEVGRSITEINRSIDTLSRAIRNLLYQTVHVATAGLTCITTVQRMADHGNRTEPFPDAKEPADHLMRNLEQLSQVIAVMLKELDRYEIPHKSLLLAQAEHVQWCQQLLEMLVGHSDLRPEEVVDHNQCRFGRWYLRAGAESYGSLAEYPALAGPHQRFHDQARIIASLHRAGRNKEAAEAFGQLVDVTRELLGLLDRLYQRVSAADADDNVAPGMRSTSPFQGWAPERENRIQRPGKSDDRISLPEL